MKKYAIIVIMIMTMTMLFCSSCGNKKEASEKPIVTYENALAESCKKLIQTGEKDSKFSDDFEFSSSDITEINEGINSYVSDDAVFIQTGEVMYRFQRSEDNLIVSYMKLKLAG